jgi:vacuolar-type H+-ATPase subunit F/Vma7
MSTIVALGEREQLQGFALVGVEVAAADDADAVRAAWRELPGGVGLVILTAAAHGALEAEELTSEAGPLAVVMPGR